MAKGRERIVVGLDVGTTKICVVVAAVDEKGWCEIKIGRASCRERV